ncbi:stalk domain-containing protein, partial [Paenibacillus xylanexedens]|uniref:stalk domain-containing protein n=1 Tax=Paenibacillus xylanexedens TaxID=528191 RepID=UPI001C92EB00
YVCEELEGEVKWRKGSDKMVVIEDIRGEEIVVRIGWKKGRVGGEEVRVREGGYVKKKGRRYVGVGFVGEWVGGRVEKEKERGWI